MARQRRKRVFPVARTRRWLAREHPELNEGLRNDVLAHILARYPRLSITSTTMGRHSPTSLHPHGFAADLAVLFAGLDSREIREAQEYMGKVGRWIQTNPKFVGRLTEGIYNAPHPRGNLSVKNGHIVPPSFWGPETFDAHDDHLHLAKR